MEKVFINPDTGKEWLIEVNGHTVRSCLNHGKIKEAVYDSDFDTKNKTAQAIMEKMRKGFVYRDSNAGFGEARCHQFVGKAYNGFLPIAASVARDDFYITRIVGDFEDEVLYHFDENGHVMERVSLGAGRMTYKQVLCADGKLLMNNSYLIERYLPESGEIVPFANHRDSMNSMLDSKENLALWYTGEKIVVFDFKNHAEVWSEEVQCQKTGEHFKTYYCEGLLSPQQTRAAYRTEQRGYVIVDLRSSEKVFIENNGWHPFFSPDDEFFSVGGKFYVCATGKETENPFPFSVRPDLTYYSTCTVKTNGRLMAVQQSNGGKKPVEIWDYGSGKLLTEIDDLLTVKKCCFEFSKSNLILHTDYGVVSVYDCIMADIHDLVPKKCEKNF
ncbi:MAG: hypothetical protein NC331_05460 [Lachnospiraceae bacterium]|nr:hypothetical protein [Lachnospiraceae bacterium]MCM1238815.1 hypothetical protein [Lachnospiraceae bacterium]MCM1304355.1 hypothetical protein [Butyrivibrio sp.]MCM1345244.1 hypothetical protein [Muribaculaceae bacterium]MCM1410061.1 hypothetical protein [Lachnospiraceae bacterium]